MSRSWLFLIGPFIQSAANIDENWRKRSGALIALRVTMCWGGDQGYRAFPPHLFLASGVLPSLSFR